MLLRKRTVEVMIDFQESVPKGNIDQFSKWERHAPCLYSDDSNVVRINEVLYSQ